VHTIYTQRALEHLEATGMRVDDVDVERLSPLGTEHITLTGRYRIALPDTLRDRGGYHELTRRRPSPLDPVFRTNSP